jgi:hypothetical protein
VVILATLTGSLYLIYWAYKTWKLLKNEAADEQRLSAHPALLVFSQISPGLRATALLSPLAIGFVPFVAPILKLLISDAILLYLLSTLVVGVASLQPNQQSFPRKHPLVVCGLVLGAGLALTGFANLKGLLFLLSLPAGALPCGFVQLWLNNYLQTVEKTNLPVRHGFNIVELLAIISGASLMGLVAAGLMIGIKAH